MTASEDAAFLGRGWRFPVGPDAGGGVATSAGLAGIEQAIRMILSTVPGERVHRPDFGCRLPELLFAPNDGRTRAVACLYVRQALERWEPRIRSIRVTPDPGEAGGRRADEMRLRIEFVVRSTNHPGNLVYPFFLQPGGRP